MKTYKLILALSVLFLTSACSDSFFDLEPSNKVTSDKLYKKAEDFNIAVVGCYAKLQSQFNYYLECVEYRSDNMLLSAPTTGKQDRYDIDQFKETAANGILQDAWANYNNGIYRCNLVLDEIDVATFDVALKNQYKAEAMFLRALTYFNMYRLWGGVPTTRKSVTIEEALTIKRSTDQEMYDFIAGDLKEIVDNNMLPTSYNGNDIGRATSGAAKALLGKVYLTFHKWAEAKEVLGQLIGKYTLVDIATLFDVNNKMNNEIIFAIRYNKSIDGEGHDFWFSAGSSSSSPDFPTPHLINAYNETNDLRKDLISLVKSGSTYIIKKYYDEKDASTTNTGNDFILLRYADVLLMYAEAVNEIAYSNSQTSDAMKALTQVRERAGLQAIDISTVPNKDTFRKALMEERQREFPFEGHRWFDLVRMGYAQEVMAASGHTIQEYQFVYPIPKTEIERIDNTEILWQNDGY